MRRYKTIVIAGLTAMLISPLAGCHKHEYEYQLSDLCEISFIGEDGSGYIEIRPKDLSDMPLKTEDGEKYTTLLADIERANLNYVSLNANNGTGVTVSKDLELSNGEEVTIGFRHKSKEFKCDIGAEPVTLEVSGLKPLQEVDLFSEKYITFTGNPETNKIAWTMTTQDGNEEEAKEEDTLGYYFDYSILAQDAVEKGSSFTAAATLNEDAVRLYGYEDGNVFLASKGFKCDGLQKELALERIQETIVVDDPRVEVDKEGIKSAIGTAMKNYGQGAINYTDIVALRPHPGVENSFFVYYYIDDGEYVDYFETAVYIYLTDGQFSAEMGNYSRPVTYEQVIKYLEKGTQLSDEIPKESASKAEEPAEEPEDAE